MAITAALYELLTKDKPAVKVDRATARVYEREAKANWKNQQRAASKHDLGIVYATVILNHYVRKGQVMDYETWLKFRLAYQDFTGSSEEAFQAMVNHPYWTNHGWDEQGEYDKWLTDEPNAWNGGEGVEGWWLAYHARVLGVFAHNPVDLEQPVLTITDMSELPQRSYLLSADTGTGKTAAQEADIQRVLANEGRIILVVNTRQLAITQAGRWKAYSPTLYLEDDKRVDEYTLKSARFLIVCAQTFARWVITDLQDAQDTALVIFDEIQQITKSAHQKHDRGDVWSDKQQREFDNAIRLLLQAGTEIHGLDAGLNEQTRLRFPGLPVIRCEMRTGRAPVTLYNRYTPVVDMLLRQREGLTVVATDTQGGKLGSKNLARIIATGIEGKAGVADARVLRLDSETIDRKVTTYDERTIAFMRDPDTEAAKYTHIVYSPTALSGLSVQFPAAVLLQFCTYLTPKDNQQMKARFRNVGAVHTYYRNARQRDAAVTPEQAYARAKTLVGQGLKERSESAMEQESIRYLGELDDLYQSLMPRDMYKALLEAEGCKVTLDWHEDERRKLESPEKPDYTEYEDQHWHEQPDEVKDVTTMTDEDYAAWRQRQHIIRVAGMAATIPEIAGDTVRLSQQARLFQPKDIRNWAVVAGVEGVSNLTMEAALLSDTPPTHIRGYERQIALLVSLSVLGYSGESCIPAELWRDNGQAAYAFLSQQQGLWDAIVPANKRWERLNDRADSITALRSMVKFMLTDWLGLTVSQGNPTRVLNPITGTQMRGMDIEGMDAVYDLLYVYEHSTRGLSKRDESIRKLASIVFTEQAAKARWESENNAFEWFECADSRYRAKFLSELRSPRNIGVPLGRLIEYVKTDLENW